MRKDHGPALYTTYTHYIIYLLHNHTDHYTLYTSEHIVLFYQQQIQCSTTNVRLKQKKRIGHALYYKKHKNYNFVLHQLIKMITSFECLCILFYTADKLLFSTSPSKKRVVNWLNSSTYPNFSAGKPQISALNYHLITTQITLKISHCTFNKSIMAYSQPNSF